MSEHDTTTKPGKVWLVGAGPGDPDLGFRLMENMGWASVIVFDRLAWPTVERFQSMGGVEMVDAGKSPGGKGMSQDEINEILISRARAGKNVIRLKGGDPFIFGRGWEEARACQKAGIEVFVRPGISSALAAPALAGIPLTLRGVSASVRIMTGQLGATPGDDEMRWREAGASDDTLVILMGVAALPEICAGLLAGGRDPETPAAIIESASLSEQRVTVAPLGDLVARADEVNVESPAVIVVGEVVGKRIEMPSGRATDPDLRTYLSFGPITESLSGWAGSERPHFVAEINQVSVAELVIETDEQLEDLLHEIGQCRNSRDLRCCRIPSRSFRDLRWHPTPSSNSRGLRWCPSPSPGSRDPR